MQTFEIPKDLSADLIKRRGRVHAYERFDPARTALLVVDMQNYFVAVDEPTVCEPARDIVPNINRLARTLRAAGGTVVWIVTEATGEADEHWANFYETRSADTGDHRRAVLVPGHPAFELYPDLEPADGDIHFVKARYSAFLKAPSGGDLEAMLRERGIETLVVTGTVTNVCCESTARDAMMIGFRTIMVSDGNAAHTDDDHTASLRGFVTTFGDVQSTDQLVTALGTAAQAAE